MNCSVFLSSFLYTDTSFSETSGATQYARKVLSAGRPVVDDVTVPMNLHSFPTRTEKLLSVPPEPPQYSTRMGTLPPPRCSCSSPRTRNTMAGCVGVGAFRTEAIFPMNSRMVVTPGSSGTLLRAIIAAFTDISLCLKITFLRRRLLCGSC